MVVAVFCLPADRLEDEVPEVEVIVVGVVTETVALAVAVVAGGATTLPLLKLTAPKAVLTEANGDEVEDGVVTAVVEVVAWPFVRGVAPFTRGVAPEK